jgi:thiamine-monophosphate kinase
MRLDDLGEFPLIARVERMARRVTGRDVVLGIGDDAALLRVRAGEVLAVTTDAFVEGVHFRFRDESAVAIGRRALVANLSDLAAMGARPIGFTFALAAPPRLDARVALELVRGALVEAKRHAAPLVGGNLTRAREVSLTIAAFGGVRAARALRRDAARAGDRLFVTGSLGRAALDRLRAERTPGGRRRAIAMPRLAAGAALARVPGIGACIDVSDGLAADLVHVLDASRVGGEVHVDALPRPAGFDAACARLRLDPRRLLLAGGEDYELLFTARGRAARPGPLARRLGVPVTEIGRITASRGRLRLLGPGLRPADAKGGWTHF